MKTCTKCNTEKELSEFNKQKRGKYLVGSKCKSCFKEYREVNKDKLKDYKKEYQEINKEKIKESQKEYYENNIEKIKEYQQSDKFKESIKKYQQSEHGKLAGIKHSSKRRALKLNAEGNFTVEEILILFDKQEGKCVYCDSELETSGNNKYHIDHIQPLSRNGTNWISNLQLLCPYCNRSKHDKTHEEYLEYMDNHTISELFKTKFKGNLK